MYINSSLRADNEAVNDYSRYSSADVYDPHLKQYRYSFKIPNINDVKVSSFKIFRNKPVAVYPDGITTYKFTTPGR